MEDRVRLFARALERVESAVDWPALGRLYCHEGGESFFGAAELAAVRDAGLALTSDLGLALEELELAGDGTGQSLYVGAAVAELCPMLFETLVLGRGVLATNLPGPEADALNGALATASSELGCRLPRIDTGPLDARVGRGGGGFSHVWMTSVLTDPEAFPALHDRLYGRGSPGPEEEAPERARALALIETLLDAADRPAVLVTTDEELELLGPACLARGDGLRVPDVARLSAIVGDPVRFCRLERRGDRPSAERGASTRIPGSPRPPIHP